MSHLSSLPSARSTPHSSRRLSSNSSSLSSLSELGMLEQQQRRSSSSSSISMGSSTGSSSNTSKTVSSSPSSNSSNMMKKLGSRFTLKRKDGTGTSASTASSASATTEDAIEELADENEVLATVRPASGRTLASSNASTARPSSIYGGGDLQQSGGTNRLRHRSSLSNLNASSSSNASVTSNSNGGVSRQPGTLRHGASISSLSGSENGRVTSPPGTALRQPGTLRHRNSISNLSASGSDIGATSPPSTITRQPGALRHRSSITSLSSVAMAKPTSTRPISSNTSSSNLPPPSRLRTMSTTTTASRPSQFDSTGSANTSAVVNNSLSNSRKLSATHTGLASIASARTRTTSLMSPPKAGFSHRPTNSTTTTANAGDTSIARRGIPKSSTTSIARIASTSSSASSTSAASLSHRRIGSLAPSNTPPFDTAATPKPSSGAIRRIPKESAVEDSPGLDDLVNNTTLQMAGLKDMLSPLATSKVSNNNNTGSTSRHQHHGSRSLSGGSGSGKAATVTGATTRPRLDSIRNTRSPIGNNVNEQEEEGAEELENVQSPSKSSLPVLQRAGSTRKVGGESSSPSPNKIRVRSASPRKVDSSTAAGDISTASSTRIEGIRKAAASSLTRDGLPVLPGVRNLAPPINAQPFPTSRRTPSPHASSRPTSREDQTRTPRLRTTPKESSNTSDDEMERLLSEEGFISPARFLTADCSTLLMQDDLSNVMMTPLRASGPSASLNRKQGSLAESALLDTKFEGDRVDLKTTEEVEVLVKVERERIKREVLDQAAKEREAMQAKATQERKAIQTQLDERHSELLKQKKEIATLQKLFSYQAKNSVKAAQHDLHFTKEEAHQSTIRRLKFELDNIKADFDRQKKERLVEKGKECWKVYEKELGVERDCVLGQLETLHSIKGLVGHIALCIEMKMAASEVQTVSVA